MKLGERKMKVWLTLLLYFQLHTGLSCWRGCKAVVEGAALLGLVTSEQELGQAGMGWEGPTHPCAGPACAVWGIEGCNVPLTPLLCRLRSGEDALWT